MNTLTKGSKRSHPHARRTKLHEMMEQPIPSPHHGPYYVPNKTEVTTITDLISSSDELIQQLEAELTCARKFNMYQRSLIAPIRRLSNEVLELIFIHVHSGGIVEIGGEAGGIWDMLHVCKRWRAVIISSHTVWPAVKAGLQARLGISGESYLNISLLNSESRPLPKLALIELIQQSHRWQSLKAYADVLHPLQPGEDEDEDPPLYEGAMQGLGELRQLYLKGRDLYDWSEVLPSWSLFSSAHNLEQIHLKGIRIEYFGLDGCQWNLPSVKRLKIDRCDGSDVIRMIGNMPSLEELTILSHCDELSNSSRETATLPALRSLHILTDKADKSWSQVSIPNLTNFRLQSCEENAEVFQETFKESKCVINCLSLDNCSRETVLSILTTLRNVKQLTLSVDSEYSSHGIQILPMLIWDPERGGNSGRLLPLLRKLDLNIMNGDEYEEISKCLTTIMKSRSTVYFDGSEADAPLSQLKCNIQTQYNLPSSEFFKAYNTLKKAGYKNGVEVEVVIKVADGTVIKVSHYDKKRGQ